VPIGDDRYARSGHIDGHRCAWAVVVVPGTAPDPDSVSSERKTVTRPSPRAWKRAGIIATLLAVGALTACGQPGAAGVHAGAGNGPAPASTSAGPDTTPSTSAGIGGAGGPSATAAPPGAPLPPNPGGAQKPPPPPLPGVSAAAQALLLQINAWRAAAGLRPYVMLPGLVASAHKHNLTMAAGCGLSHRCKGEAAFGDRIHAEGVNWHSAGENCGVGGGVANTSAAITTSAKGLDQSMFDERAPDDGHRQNILSSSFTHIGIDVIRDSKGNVWLTQDFTS
jgi:uncharacterized protein YkwD